jgi:hypothetical protein
MQREGGRLYGTANTGLNPVFAHGARKVRIGLATDGFTPFSDNASSYSCWPVFAILYNLPPSLYMKYEFMFLCLVVPSPDHLGLKLNVILRPLINELKELWNGVEAYDSQEAKIHTLSCISVSNLVMPHQHPSNSIFHIVLHNKIFLKEFISLIWYPFKIPFLPLCSTQWDEQN